MFLKQPLASPGSAIVQCMGSKAVYPVWLVWQYPSMAQCMAAVVPQCLGRVGRQPYISHISLYQHCIMALVRQSSVTIIVQGMITFISEVEEVPMNILTCLFACENTNIASAFENTIIRGTLDNYNINIFKDNFYLIFLKALYLMIYS